MPWRTIQAKFTWDLLCLDLWDSGVVYARGNKYILTVIDGFSKFAFAIPVRNKEAKTIAKMLVERVFLFGKPRRLRIDGGSEFINSSLLGKTGPILFYQVLVEDSSKISLYKLIKTKFQRANPEDMSTVKSGNFTSAFVDDITYYIGEGKDLTRINLTENNIYKVLRSRNDKVNTYFNLNGNKDLNEQFLIELIKYLNN